MQIAILEDQIEDAELLCALLKRYAQEQQLDLTLLCHSSASELFSTFEKHFCELAFLDIYLKQGETTGMEVARRLRAEHPACKLVFATISDAHAVEGYSTRAISYLIKPISYEALCEAMALCEVQFFRERQCIRFYSRGLPTSVVLGELCYVDCVGRQTKMHLSTGAVAADLLMSEAQKQLLAHDRFLLCNRDLLVNMDWIAQIETNFFLLKNGERVPIRNRGRREVKKAYVAYRAARLLKAGL